MSREGQAKVLNIAEFRRAEKAAMMMRHGLRNRAILYLSFSLALRVGEIAQLKIKDVYLPDGTINEDINLSKNITKNKQQRHVYLTNRKTKEILLEYILDMKKKIESRRFKNKFNPNDPLFPSQKGCEFLSRDIVRVFASIYNLAGIKDAKSHSGRRTFISTKIDEGIDIKAIADLVGHKNIQTTIGYHQKNPNRLKKISEKSIF